MSMRSKLIPIISVLNLKSTMAKSTEKGRSFPMPSLVMYYLQLLVGHVILGGIYYGGYYWCESIPVPSSTDLVVRLSYTLRCTLPMFITLLFAVFGVAFHRGTNKKVHANPLAGNDHLIQVDKNYLQNTLEQTVIAVGVLFVATTYFNEPDLMKIVPIFVLAFIISRILFRIGYGISPYYRLIGIIMTFLNTGLLAIYVMYLMYTQGFMFDLGGVAYPADKDNMVNVEGKTEL